MICSMIIVRSNADENKQNVSIEPEYDAESENKKHVSGTNVRCTYNAKPVWELRDPITKQIANITVVQI